MAQRVQRSLIFWASLNSHSLEKKWVRSLFHSHFQKLSALLIITLWYSIVKDSSTDLGVNSKIVQNRPTVKQEGRLGLL